jgi:hypothetical protein
MCDQLINKPVRDFRIDHWLLLSTILLCNGFFNIYVFVYGCFGALAAIAIHMLRRIHSRLLSVESGKHLKASLLAMLLVSAINGYIYYHYMGALTTFGARDPNEIIRNLPKPFSWLTDSGQLLVPGPFQINTIGTGWGVHGAEQELFPGWGLLILLCLSVISCTRLGDKAVRDHLRAWLVTIGIMLVMTICIKDLSLWPVVSKLLPGATSLRASSRVAAIIIFFSAAPISIAASSWRINVNRHTSMLLSTSILLASFATIWRTSFYQFSLLEWIDYNSRIVKTLESTDCDLFWLNHGDMHPTVSNIHAMHAQFKTGIPTLNGYSGHRPLGQDWQLEEQSFRKYLEWFAKENQNGGTPKAHTKSAKACILSRDKSLKEFRAKIREIKIKS